jgi:hypothetical protein
MDEFHILWQASCGAPNKVLALPGICGTIEMKRHIVGVQAVCRWLFPDKVTKNLTVCAKNRKFCCQ